MKNSWSYGVNTFEVNTRGSYRKMNSLSTDHFGKINAQVADPDFNNLFLELQTDYQVWRDQYSDWVAGKSRYSGSTANFVGLIDLLAAEKIRHWDVQIQVIHDERSTGYKKLLQHGRSPFQKGSYEDRVSEVEALFKNVTNDTALPTALGTEIGNFLATLSTARTEQQGLEGEVSEFSSKLELQRIKLSETLYSVMGGLMRKFKSNPTEIENFYDLELIRTVAKDEGIKVEPAVTLVINPGATVESGLNLTPATAMRIRNSGASALSLWVSTSAGTPNGPDALILNPGEEIEKIAAELGDPNGTYLNITNANPGLAGEVEVTIL